MSEKDVLVEEQVVVDKKAVKKVKEHKVADEKPHRILNFLSKEYKGENIIMLILALFAMTIGVLIVNGTLAIDPSYFLVGIGGGKLVAWILIGLAVVSLLFVFIPIYRPSVSEIKHLSGLTKSQFLVNVARTLCFIIALCLFFLLCDLALDFILNAISK